MRLYSLRYHAEDGQLRNLRRAKGSQIECHDTSSKRRKIKKDYLRPHQGSSFEDVTGTEDRMNVVHLHKLTTYVFCTPRCFTTKSWEVGICNTYFVRYLCGGKSPSSFDMHIMMVMECMQVYLQYVEIRDQSVGYFYLPEDLRLPMKMKTIQTAQSCKHLYRLLELLVNIAYGDTAGLAVTHALSQLEVVRMEYFNDLHLQPDLSKRSAHRSFLKMLGMVYGRILCLLDNAGIVLRQYYGQCPVLELVSWTCILKNL